MRFNLFLLVLAFSAPTAALANAEKSPVVCWTLPSLMNRFAEAHVAMPKTQDTLADRIVETYARRLDPFRSILTVSDYDELARRVRLLASDAKKGRCAQFDWLRDSQLRWHQNLERFVRAELAPKDFAIDRTITIYDRDEQDRPKTKKARDALRRDYIHYLLANYVRSGTSLEDAKKKLIHRYELMTKRISEMDDADRYAEFLRAYANALDPHSTYFSADDLEDFRISMGLSLEGIGAVLSSIDGYTIVSEVVPGGAADRHGKLKAQDKIIAVTQIPGGEAVDVIDMALRDVVRQIRGKKGTKVKLTVVRKGESTETLDFIITRDKIDLKEQAAKLHWETVARGGERIKLAVLDLPSFYGGSRGARNCVDDVKRLLKEARVGGAQGLVLDLSRNGGGLLKASVDISGFFISEGPVVAIDGPATPTQVLEDTDDGVAYAGPLVVLISRGSASASEILAGALKDYSRAVIVGDTQTFGKGTVQNIIDLPPGFGALKVTTAMFFRPSGRSTQSAGVHADVLIPSIYDNDEYAEKKKPFALETRSIPKFSGSRVRGTGAEAWRPMDVTTIQRLRSNSTARVDGSKDFAELREDIDKYKKGKGAVKLSEMLDDKKGGDAAEKKKGAGAAEKKDENAAEKKDENAAEKKDENAAEKKKDAQLSIQTKEALQILADLVQGA